MKVQIKVTYEDAPNAVLDEKIIELLESVGAVWWARGFDPAAQERNIAFDLEVET